MSLANNEHDVHERVSRIEATLETFVVTVSKDIQDTNQNVDSLRHLIQDSLRTPWQNYIAAAGVLLQLLTMFGSGYIRDLGRIENTQEKGLISFVEHVSDGHPNALRNEVELYREVDNQRVDTLGARLGRLELWQAAHSAADAEAHAGHGQQLRMLEKQVDMTLGLMHERGD